MVLIDHLFMFDHNTERHRHRPMARIPGLKMSAFCLWVIHRMIPYIKKDMFFNQKGIFITKKVPQRYKNGPRNGILSYVLIELDNRQGVSD